MVTGRFVGLCQQQPPAFPVAGDPFAYITADGVPRVVYRGLDFHIHELRLQGSWLWADLSGTNDTALGDPFAYVTPDGVPRVVYRTLDFHIHELRLEGSWIQADLTAISNAPALPAAGDPFAYFTRDDNVPRIVYSVGRGYNECCFLATHNAYKNYEDTYTGPNQSPNLYRQLEKGARSLLIDIYYEVPMGPPEPSIIPDPGVYVLGEVNEHGWIPGLTFPSNAQPMRLHDTLNQVGSWLDGNPNEVVTIFLEDYTTPDQLEAEIGLVGQTYQAMMYHPGVDPNWQVPDKKNWPLMSDLITWNKRLILFSDHNGQNDTLLHVAYDRDYTKQNYYSLGPSGTNWDCPSRWNNGQYLDDNPKLLLFTIIGTYLPL